MSAAKSSLPTHNSTANARPFLKWAGGKSQLLSTIEKRIPKQLKIGKDFTYIEPFVGSGAVLFHLLQRYKAITRAVIIDNNADLILTYRVIKSSCESLIRELDRMQAEFHAGTERERRETFARTRAHFNSLRKRRALLNRNESAAVLRAAEFIFLNRTCFNGLFRVNRAGEFNVPFGRYANPKISDPDNLRKAAKLLARCEIIEGDYTRASKYLSAKEFVYFDPPYRPISKTSSFTAYGKKRFGDPEQRRLSRFVRKLAARANTYVMLSNSDPAAVDSKNNLLDKLYLGLTVKRVSAKRMINRNASGRGAIKELLVTNY